MDRGVSVRVATHVRVGNEIEKIIMKWGIRPDGTFAKPSEGGFGVITESGRRVTMLEANEYLRERNEM